MEERRLTSMPRNHIQSRMRSDRHGRGRGKAEPELQLLMLQRNERTRDAMDKAQVWRNALNQKWRVAVIVPTPLSCDGG